MSNYQFSIQQESPYRINFTHYAFDRDNLTLVHAIAPTPTSKVLVFVEKTLAKFHESLVSDIDSYFQHHWPEASHFCGTCILHGGEKSKQNFDVWQSALDKIVEARIDRHSTILVIGGGAFLDVIGFAAATAHRGIRLIRLPSTTLSQADSGVGVKNGINYQGQKNYLGTFAIPWATINDFTLLHAQPDELKRDGLVEIVKVALIKDADFFCWLENNAADLFSGAASIMEHAVETSAILHAKHIAEGGDPFEQGSSRPLDFGHWTAHYLECLSDYSLSHAQAVAIGICLDVLYSQELGWLSQDETNRIIRLIQALGFKIYSPLLEQVDGEQLSILHGLDAFREHLGGELTILMLQSIGNGQDVHSIDAQMLARCIQTLASYPTSSSHEIS